VLLFPSCKFVDRFIVMTKSTIHESTRNHIPDFVEPGREKIILAFGAQPASTYQF
jgi:hypothetical protein